MTWIHLKTTKVKENTEVSMKVHKMTWIHLKYYRWKKFNKKKESRELDKVKNNIEESTWDDRNSTKVLLKIGTQ